MKTASPLHLVVAVIVAMALLAMAASVRAQSCGVFVDGVALDDRRATVPEAACDPGSSRSATATTARRAC